MTFGVRRSLAASFAALAALAAAAPARAADVAPDKAAVVEVGPKGEPQSVAVDVRRLGIELELYAVQAQRQRLARAVAGFGIGAVMLPSGIVLLNRTDGISRALVIGMVIGGTAQLITVPLLFIPTRMDKLRDEFMSRPTGVENKATIRQFENEWRQAAETARTTRIYAGTALTIFGTVNLAASLTLLLAHEGLLGMSRRTQYTVGGVMMGIGAPVTTQGVRFLFEWSLEESSWEAYRNMKSDAVHLARRRSPSLSVAPTPGGALVFASTPF